MRTLHVGLRITDQARSLAFYRGLGYVVVGTVAETRFGRLTMLRLPDDDFVSLELVHDPRHGQADPGGFNHLVIQVDSMHQTVAALAMHGVPVDGPHSPDGSPDFLTALVTDPDGYRIELVQWPAGHPAGMTAADFAT